MVDADETDGVGDDDDEAIDGDGDDTRPIGSIKGRRIALRW